MNSRLLIGGTHDGERVHLDCHRIYLPKKQEQRPSAMMEMDIARPVMMEREVYFIMKFRGYSRCVCVYALEGMTPDDVLDALLAGYGGNR